MGGVTMFWIALLLLGVVRCPVEGQVTMVDLCTYYNYTVPNTNLAGDMTVLVSAASTAPVTGSTPNLVGTPDANGMRYDVFYNSVNASMTVPNMTVTKTLEINSPRKVFIRTTLSHHDGSSWPGLYDVTMQEQVGPGLLLDPGPDFKPGIFAPGVTTSGRNQITWTINNITANDSRTIEYFAVAAGRYGHNLPQGESYYVSTITFFAANTSTAPISFETEVCVERIDNIITNLFYQHGFTALAFFLALFLGILVIVLLVFILLKCCQHRGCVAAVAPRIFDMKKFKEKGKKIVMDAKAALKKGFNAIKDFSLLAVDESIILILALKDRLQMFREIDNLDILSTIHVDTDIEKEQNEAAVQTSLLLIQSLRHNGDISAQTETKVTSDFNARLQDLDRRLQADYKKAMEEVFRNLSTKNKEKFTQLIERHKQEKADALEKAKDSTEEDRAALLKLVDQQHQTEENEQTYILALEQNEEAEKLRKEFAIRKRMGIKEEQQHLLDNTCTTGQLAQQQADWLLKEHTRQQDEIHRMYDEEISRQRMILEEKLARRRALAHASEAQGDDHVEMLNTMASHQVMAIQKMRKKDSLSVAQAEEYMQKVKSEMLEVKEKMEREKERQEAELHKKLSQRKQQRLADKKKQQEQVVQDYINRSKSQQTDGPMDPVAFAEGLLKLRSQHRMEMNDFENDIDGEHFHELEEVRNQIAFDGRKELKGIERNLLRTLQNEEGMSENQVNKLLKEHDAELEDLLSRQQIERNKQADRLKEELERRHQEWSQRKAQEKREQEELREHEARVVKKLINSQMSISEAERDQIMKEHEKQMVKLENSLTLNKLRQKRMLEEKLMERRAQQLEKLQQKQDKEVQKHRRAAENNGEESDEETHRQEVTLMKKYAEKRIAVLQGSELNLEEEMAQIRQEMTKERALALKSQEERLGALIASLQLQKAREMARIEDQQKAINNLKINLMDDLTERGVLSNPECERIIQRHKEDQEELTKRLDSQRKKQEKVIQQKLQSRLQQRETSLLANQEREMQAMIQASGSTTASKIRRALLMHKQMLQLEQFRNQSDREVNQVLEDMRRKHEVIRLKAIQDQELQFIAGLVKVGGLQQQELGAVLQMLYPGKTQAQLQEVLDKIADRTQPAHPPGQEADLANSSLMERVRATQLASGLSSRQSSLRSNQGSKKRLGATKKRSSQLSLVSSLNEDSLIGDGGKKKSKLKRGSIGAQGVNINGGFEPDDYPVRPSSALRGSLSGLEEYPGSHNRRQSAGSYGFDNRDDDFNVSGTRSSLGGYRHNAPIDEEDYEYPHQNGYSRQDGYGEDFIGMGTGRQDDYSTPGQRKLPPLDSVPHKGKKKKKLLKKLAHRSDDELL